jgi:hypothetical protein
MEGSDSDHDKHDDCYVNDIQGIQGAQGAQGVHAVHAVDRCRGANHQDDHYPDDHYQDEDDHYPDDHYQDEDDSEDECPEDECPEDECPEDEDFTVVFATEDPKDSKEPKFLDDLNRMELEVIGYRGEKVVENSAHQNDSLCYGPDPFGEVAPMYVDEPEIYEPLISRTKVQAAHGRKLVFQMSSNHYPDIPFNRFDSFDTDRPSGSVPCTAKDVQKTVGDWVRRGGDAISAMNCIDKTPREGPDWRMATGQVGPIIRRRLYYLLKRFQMNYTKTVHRSNVPSTLRTNLEKVTAVLHTAMLEETVDAMSISKGLMLRLFQTKLDDWGTTHFMDLLCKHGAFGVDDTRDKLMGAYQDQEKALHPSFEEKPVDKGAWLLTDVILRAALEEEQANPVLQVNQLKRSSHRYPKKPTGKQYGKSHTTYIKPALAPHPNQHPIDVQFIYYGSDGVHSIKTQLVVNLPISERISTTSPVKMLSPRFPRNTRSKLATLADVVAGMRRAGDANATGEHGTDGVNWPKVIEFFERVTQFSRWGACPFLSVKSPIVVFDGALKSHCRNVGHDKIQIKLGENLMNGLNSSSCWEGSMEDLVDELVRLNAEHRHTRLAVQVRRGSARLFQTKLKEPSLPFFNDVIAAIVQDSALCGVKRCSVNNVAIITEQEREMNSAGRPSRLYTNAMACQDCKQCVEWHVYQAFVLQDSHKYILHIEAQGIVGKRKR